MDIRPLKATDLKPPLNVTLVRDDDGLNKLQNFFDRFKVPGWDVETTPLKDYFWRRLRTCQFGNQAEQYVIDLRAFCENDPDLLYKAQGEYGKHLTPGLKRVIEVVKPVVCSKDFLKVGVNLSFEYECFYWLLGLRTFNFFDCALVEKCIWAGAHSMKDYAFYSMEEMMARYFGVQIDKGLQESFTLEADLTGDQIAYAALDTRFPHAIMQGQKLILQGETVKSLIAKRSAAAKILKNIDPLVTGDNLEEIAQIENDAIGAFEDMHIHGERLDRERWIERTNQKIAELATVVTKELDPIFIPIVGKKSDANTDEEIAAAEAKWKSYNVISDAELKLKGQIHQNKKLNPALAADLEGLRAALEVERKAEKEKLKELCGTMKKKRTAIKNLSAKCEGEALINYGSNTQLLNVLKGMKGLKSLSDLEDETLEKYEHIPVMSAIRKYHGLSKEIGTYGIQWATEWTTKPCKDEGWLHPGDGRLHCVFNQYDAATGRSTSEKPNGQNLPQDKEVRSCFIADPADESIRISVCCDEEAVFQTCEDCHPDHECGQWKCPKCNLVCETKAEEYVIVTADMSGAELRIIAELADDPVWIGAFARDEDVHSVGTELLYPEEWPKLAFNGHDLKDEKTGEMKPYWCDYYKLHTEESVKKNPKRVLGAPMRQKCKCPEHNEKRNDNKSQNFLIAYGGTEHTLAARIKKAVEFVRGLIAKHKAAFPRIWDYLDKSGKMSQMLKKSFDMFGRRRLFPEPTWDRAKEKARADREEKLRYEKEEADKNKANFIALHGRKPNKEELWLLTHRLPTGKEVANAFKAMHGSIERQGKNHAIQGTNATIAKKAMGCGYCPAGKPYLWHVLPLYKAKLIKFVHDELVVMVPKRFANKVAELIGDAFKRAAAEKMKKVVMEFDFNIATYWKK